MVQPVDKTQTHSQRSWPSCRAPLFSFSPSTLLIALGSHTHSKRQSPLQTPLQLQAAMWPSSGHQPPGGSHTVSWHVPLALHFPLPLAWKTDVTPRGWAAPAPDDIMDPGSLLASGSLIKRENFRSGWESRGLSQVLADTGTVGKCIPSSTDSTWAPFLTSDATAQDTRRLEMSRERDNVWKPTLKRSGLLKDAPYKWVSLRLAGRSGVHWEFWEQGGFTGNCGKNWSSLETVGRIGVSLGIVGRSGSTEDCGKKRGSSVSTCSARIRNIPFWPQMEARPTQWNDIINITNSWGYTWGLSLGSMPRWTLT